MINDIYNHLMYKNKLIFLEHMEFADKTSMKLAVYKINV